MLKKILKKTHDTFRVMRMHVGRLTESKIEINPAPKKSTKSTKLDALPIVPKTELIISAGTIAKVVTITMLLGVLGFFVYEIKDILVLFFISLLLAAALDPMVDALEARRVPRAIGVLILYALLLIVIGIFVTNLVPVFAKEVTEILSRVQDWVAAFSNGNLILPASLEWARPKLETLFNDLDASHATSYKEILVSIGSTFSGVAGNLLTGVVSLFNGIFNLVLVLVLTFMMSIDERGIDNFILSMFPTRYADYIQSKSDAIKEKMGYWLRGQVMLCVLVGLLTYIGLFIVGVITKPVEYDVTISLLAGFTELIPYVGPVIAWAIALPIVANQSLFLVIWLTVVLYAVQALENNLLVPLVMKHAVGISPIFVMFAMFVGLALLGIVGMILAIPVATAISLFVKDYTEKTK